jgi:hypothetical protein
MTGNGNLDLVVLFDTKELAANDCLEADDTEAMITDETFDGEPL